MFLEDFGRLCSSGERIEWFALKELVVDEVLGPALVREEEFRGVFGAKGGIEVEASSFCVGR